MQFNCENYTELAQDVQFNTAAGTWYWRYEGLLGGAMNYIGMHMH